MRLRRFIRQAHRWLGLLIGVQMLLWVTGGLVMSALRIDEVRGADRAAEQKPAVLKEAETWISPTSLLERHSSVTEIVVATLDMRPVYRVKSREGVETYDARTGARLSPMPRDLAQQIALSDYAGQASIAGIDWVEEPGVEYRGRPVPLWRVRFADDRNTALYISPQTGDVVARRNDIWRLFDFVWMFHIMDYEERENINNPLLVMTAATALLFVLTGAAMLAYSLRRARSA